MLSKCNYIYLSLLLVNELAGFNNSMRMGEPVLDLARRKVFKNVIDYIFSGSLMLG